MVQNMLYYKQRNGCFIQESSDDEDDKYSSGFFHDWDAQNLRRINQRKGNASFRQTVPIRTIRTMNTTAGLSLIGILKICTALNKEKSVASFRLKVTMRTIRTMI